MAEDNKVDLTAKLPDEVLVIIFGHLPSLRDKLRLESVNTRFQRCLLQLLRTRPIPFTYTYNAKRVERLNGYRLPKPLGDVLQSLGKKAKFNSIDINVCYRRVHRFDNRFAKKLMDSVVAALVSSDIDCLDKVTTFKVHSCDCKETLLRDLFAKCTQLFAVRFRSSPRNLCEVLKDKALTLFAAELFHYTQEQVIQMFQSIKPNTLKKIDLQFGTTLNMDVLVDELFDGGWSALEEIDIDWHMHNVPTDTLFSSLTRLPALRKCNFVLRDMRRGAGQQLIPALASLATGLKFVFANRAEITVDYGMDWNWDHGPTGCQLVALIRQVQSVHPDLEVGLGPYCQFLTLTLGKVSFRQNLYWPEPCDNAECPECRIFFPTVLSRIRSEANRIMKGGQPEVHLANAQLDRCRVDSVAGHLNQRWFGGKALVAEMNEDHNLATITIKPIKYSRAQFKITVDCGHCLTSGCFACL